MKVLIVIITKDFIKNECFYSIMNQDYEDYSIMVHIKKPKEYGNSLENKFKNCSENREEARKMALSIQADYFLFVDSDIVLPKDCITKLVKQKKHAIGGYYPMKNGMYCAGKWAADNVFLNFRGIAPSLVMADMIGLGCAMFSREALLKVNFRHGLDKKMSDGNRSKFLGECADLGNQLYEKGYKMYMDGSVVCEHLFN